MHRVFKVLARLTPLIVTFQKSTHKAHAHLLESLLERLALVALQPAARQASVQRLAVTPREVRGWSLCSVRALECEKVLESKRPYAPCTDEYTQVVFPGASYIRVTFSDETSTGSSARKHTLAPCSVQRALLTPQGKHGSLDRCGKST